IERGLHQPSIKVIKSLADALNLSAEVMLAQAAGLDEYENTPPNSGTEAAIRADVRLSESQKQALLAVYRSFLSAETVNGSASASSSPPSLVSRWAAAASSPSPATSAWPPTTRRSDNRRSCWASFPGAVGRNG